MVDVHISNCLPYVLALKICKKPHGFSHHVAKFAIWGYKKKYTGDLDKAIYLIYLLMMHLHISARFGVVQYCGYPRVISSMTFADVPNISLR